MAFTRITKPRPFAASIRPDQPSALAQRLIREGCERKAQPSPTGGRLGLALGALRDIANDMPGTRAAHKRTAMRERAEAALREIYDDLAPAHRQAAE